jgi:hypothetical protein
VIPTIFTTFMISFMEETRLRIIFV